MGEAESHYRSFQQLRRENARVEHDHEDLDRTEKMLFEMALKEKLLTSY